MLIGKGGEQIKKLQEESGAEIKIAKQNAEEDDPNMKTVTITGQPDAVESAQKAVEQLVGRAVKKVGDPKDANLGPKLKEPPPPGYEPRGDPLYLHNAALNLYYEITTCNIVWKDPTSGKMAPFHRGLDLPYCFKGHAVARVDKGSVSARQPAPKSVAIPDLHRAGTALKMNLDHLDRPAAMVGVYGNAEEGNGVPADVTARTFHGELLKRLSSYRGQWQDNAYVLALAGALADISAANDGKLPTAAVCLVIGHRAAVVATQGARLYVFTGAAGETQPCDAIEVGGAATCYQEVGSFHTILHVVIS
jgi:hypothetical protein